MSVLSSLGGVYRRELARRDLRRFVDQAWPTIEPTRALLPSVAVDGMCAALTAVGEGRIRRLGIACPPGVSKSLLCSVAFPAWMLLRSGGKARLMCGSYSHDFGVRDARRTRDLVSAETYRRLTGGAWSIREDSAAVGDWSTNTGGRRLVVSPSGRALGERCSVQVIDDALSGADVHSPAAKREARRWIAEVLSTRLEDPEHDARVLVGQRLAVDDPLALAAEQGWTMLVLPAVLDDGDAPCELRDDAGRLVWRDPRRPREALVELLGTDALARLRGELGSTAFAAMYLQRPSDDSSAMFPRAWLGRRWTSLPERIDREVIALDASFKEGDASDFAVLQCWAASGGDRFLVEQWRRQAGFADTLAALRAMVARHPRARVVVELAANGYAIVDQLRRELPGVVGVRPEGGKVARAASVQAVVESGAVVLPAHASWVDPFLDEVCAFQLDGGGVKNDDQVDAMSLALRQLAPRARHDEGEPHGGRVFDLLADDPRPGANPYDSADASPPTGDDFARAKVFGPPREVPRRAECLADTLISPFLPFTR